jgi:predicted permease
MYNAPRSASVIAEEPSGVYVFVYVCVCVCIGTILVCVGVFVLCERQQQQQTNKQNNNRCMGIESIDLSPSVDQRKRREATPIRTLLISNAAIK